MLKFVMYIAAVLLAFFYTPDGMAKSPPPGTGNDDVPANILIMLDTSGSMDTVLPLGDSHYPIDVAFDSLGNIYVAKYYDVVEKYDSSGTFLFQWGGYSNAPVNGKFDLISSIAIDSNDNIYVADRYHERVQKFDTDGNYISQLDTVTSPVQGVAVDSSDNVYVIVGGVVKKFSSAGTLLSTWSNSGATHLIFDSNDDVYLTRSSAKKIEKRSSAGTFISSFNTSFTPYGIEIAPSGNLFISGRTTHKIYEFTTTGTLLNTTGQQGSGISQYNQPSGVTKGLNGTIYVADYSNHRIKSVTDTLLITPSNITRLEAAQGVIQAIVSDSNLTAGANFGLMEWNSSATMLVNISSLGASQIFTTVSGLNANGGTVLDAAMNLAQSYFLGPSSPIDPNLSDCQENILIVVSDGFWTDTTASATAQSLYTNNGIKTFTVGFATTGNSNYVTLSQAGGTYPDSPLYANNQAELLSVLSGYIQQVISSSLTFTAPTIIPSAANNESILQSTFTYKTDHQWKGRLLKYALLPDGNVGSLQWDAGDLLNQVLADNRSIWTLATALTPGLNNFVNSNFDRLRQPIEEFSGTSMDDQELMDFIDFVRGKDIYSEFATGVDDEGEALLTGERWKLADIYHSKAAIVGAPSAYFSDASHPNSDSYYRFINNYNGFKQSAECGTTCVSRDEVIYVGSNGGMLHAFLSSTGAELWAFVPPSILGSLRNMLSTTANTTNSIFGVDGSPAVKDIYYNSQWHTILVSGLRQGGNSYFALDITDPYNPEHLFTLASWPLSNKVSYWDSTGTRTDYDTTGTVPSDFDYSELGESWSQPVIFRIKVSGVDRWVAAIAGGYNNAINPNYGAVVYVLDLENGGRILQKIDLPDTDAADNIISSVPPRLTAITADSSTLFQDAGALIYVSDLEGKVWEINMTDQGTMYSKTVLFDAESTNSNGRHAFQELTAAVGTDQHLMLFYGTGNMQQLGEVSASLQNRAYGIRELNFPSYVNATPFTTAELQDTSVIGASCPSGSQKGWYINLAANEKITAKVTVNNEVVFLPRYIPNATAQCSPGTATLSEINFMCGDTIRDTSLGSGVPTEAIVYENKVYIGVSDDGGSITLPPGFVKSGNLIVGDPAVISSGKVRLESWKEEF